MFKDQIIDLIKLSLVKLLPDFSTKIYPEIVVDHTKNKQHGDFASNIALIVAQQLGRKPYEIATIIVENLPNAEFIAKVNIAGPGFINFFLAPQAILRVVKTILQHRKNFGTSTIGNNKKILLEFVSSNPTGSLHVGHGRHAAFGDVVANLLKSVGYLVYKEYYVNDSGRQIDILSISVLLRYLEINYSKQLKFPDDCYQGDYIITIAQQLHRKYGDIFDIAITIDNTDDDPEIYLDKLIEQAKLLLKEQFTIIRKVALNFLVADMQQDLAEFGVHYDRWFAESELQQSNMLQNALDKLNQVGQTYNKDGALWFKSSNFGDDKDRVLIRTNGQATYFANDIAYHLTKFDRGFNIILNIIGADHHGYVPRITAAMQVCNIAINSSLKFVTLQDVSLYQGKDKYTMSTRQGDFITLRELRQEVGNEATRFFYLNCKHQQHINFDLALAKKQSNENPIYYIQYAHARIASLFRAIIVKNITYDQQIGQDNLHLLTHELELNLVNLLTNYPEVILISANNYEPYFLTHYLRKLAGSFHSYYNCCQFLIVDDNLRQARLVLSAAVGQVLNNGLAILGIAASENM